MTKKKRIERKEKGKIVFRRNNRRRYSADGKYPFEVLYGVKSRFSEENEASILPSTKEERGFELAIALVAHAERVVPRMVMEEQKFKTGD